MKILSIETSCDETALALIEANGGLKNPRFKILKNLVASQIKIHQPFGGVVPNLAKREHIKNLPVLFRKIFGISNFQFPIFKQVPNSKFQILNSIDLIAVTIGPGLEPCLWAGIGFAKDLAKKWGKPLIGVNHLEGHLYSFLLKQKTAISNFQFPPISSRVLDKVGTISNFFPAIALIVSGGHTILLLMKDLTHYKKLGETRDDAAGEAFDKVARLLNLSYPGGPELEKLAKYRSSTSIDFPRPMLNQKNYDFSFSGLKTAVLYYLRDQNPCLSGRQAKAINSKLKADVAASFQQATIDVLTAKTFRAAKEFKAKSIWLSGGVANNKALRKKFQKEAKKKKINFFAPSLKFTTDNASMTAVAAYFNHLKNKKHRLIAQGDLNI